MSNIPPGTWTGDPNATWNQPDGGPCGIECDHYKPCPCGDQVYCVAYDQWFDPRDAVAGCPGFGVRR